MPRRASSIVASTLAIAGLTVAQLVAVSGVPAGASSKGPILEGVVTAFSGPAAFEGAVNMAGVLPAVYQIDKAGGILGHKLEVATVDTKGDAADALPLVERFLGAHSNLVGITGPSTTAPVTAPIINKAKITMFSYAGQAVFDRNKMPYFWRLLPPDPANGIAMAIWAKERGFTRVAAVFGTTTSASGDLPGVLAGVKDLHLNLVDNVSVTPSQVSYKSDAAKLLAAHPQAIMTEMDATSAATFFSDLSQIGTVPTVIGDGADATPTWVKGVSAAVGAQFFAKKFSIVNVLTPKPNPANAAMIAGVKAEASKLTKPITHWFHEPYAAAGYDGVSIQALAMVAAHSIKPTVYNKYIMKVTKPGKGKTIVYTYAAGVKALEQGKQIEYVGASGKIELNKYHNSFGNQAAIEYPKGTLVSARVVKVITAAQVEKIG